MRTRFTKLIGCDAPLQLAGMPGIATPALAAAVADAGGLGMIGAASSSPDALATTLADLRGRTTDAIGVNFLMPFLDPACVPVAARAARVVEFFYGEPDRALVAAVHSGGALASWQVGSVREAMAAVDSGCDLVVAQGTEAGGHVRGALGLLPLLDQVLEAVRVPVVAAGGIGSARAVAAALAAGAAAVRIGTRFVAAAESGAHPRYVAALLAARGDETILTDAFSVLWPDAPHRVLRSCVDAARNLSGDIAGEVEWGGQTVPVPRFGVMVPTVTTRGTIEAMALYAGESVGNVRRVQPAAEIVRELMTGAEELLRSALGSASL
jgi:nitronate monooxygenase